MAGFHFAQMPDEVVPFVDFLEKKAGDVWARWVGDPPREPRFEPMPIAKFLQTHGARLSYQEHVDLYLGLRADVLEPETITIAETVNGVQVSRTYVYHSAANLVRYHRGEIASDGILNSTTVGYHTSFLKGNTTAKKSKDFVKWATKVTSWWRKRATHSVPIHRCNYEIPATEAVYLATQDGLKVR